MRKIRDFLRRRRVARYVAQHGYWFDFHGVRVRIPEDSAPGVGNALLRGKYEREEAEFVLGYLPEHLAVIELGGSLGVVSSLIRSRLLDSTQHLIVEANPSLMSICRENAGDGQAGTTQVLNRAVGYDAPMLRFAVGDSVHANHLLREGDPAERIVEVRSVTLAELLTFLGPDEGFVLVCDIEGGELDLVRNEGRLLDRAAMIIMELHPKAYPTGVKDEAEIIKIMQDLGFHLESRKSDVCLWLPGV